MFLFYFLFYRSIPDDTNDSVSNDKDSASVQVDGGGGFASSESTGGENPSTSIERPLNKRTKVASPKSIESDNSEEDGGESVGTIPSNKKRYVVCYVSFLMSSHIH